MTTPAPPTLAEVEAALHRSQQRLAAVVTNLTPEQLGGPSYDPGWTVADVLSHLGSGAEIFHQMLEAGLADREPPAFEDLVAVWDAWNARTPEQQAADSLAANAAFLARVGALAEDERAQFSVEAFNGRQDLLGLARLRLGEHAVHTWDVLVVADPQAEVAPDATAALLPGIDELVARAGQRSEVPLRVAVTTSELAATFLLEADGDGPRLVPGPAADADATLALSAAAFIRLVYGRLDAEHTADVRAEGVELATLRQVFPGF